MLLNLPAEIVTFLVAAMPVSELRGSIPLAIGVYDLSVSTALFWSILGNIFAVVLVLWLLEPFSKYLSHHSYFFNRFFNWLFERARKKHTKSFDFLGSFALILFVAIPLPITGGWTGSVAAFVFGVSFKKALPLISIGILIAATIVTLATLGIINFLGV